MQAHFSLVSNFGGEKLKVVAVLLQFFCTAHGCCLGRCQLAAHINIDSGVALLARSTGRAWQQKKKNSSSSSLSPPSLSTPFMETLSQPRQTALLRPHRSGGPSLLLLATVRTREKEAFSTAIDTDRLPLTSPFVTAGKAKGHPRKTVGLGLRHDISVMHLPSRGDAASLAKADNRTDHVSPSTSTKLSFFF